MKAAVYHGRGDVRVEEVGDPVPAPGEVVLRVQATGICGTDANEYAFGPILFPINQRHKVSGHIGPMVLGHEIAGWVVAVGEDVDGLKEGDLVVTGAGISCGACAWCRVGRTNLCVPYNTVGLHRDGGLAQFGAVPASTCLPVQDLGVSGDTAAMAQPMSIAVHSMRQGHPAVGDQVLVIGAGGIGAFLTYALAHHGAQVLVADLNADRLETARQLGAAGVLQPAGPSSLVDELRDDGVEPAVVYEVTGTTGGLDIALSMVAPGGRVVAVGLHEHRRELDVLSLTLREVQLIGTNAHVCARDMPKALELLAARNGSWADMAGVAIGLDRLVDDGIVPLVEGRPTQIKTLVDPWVEGTRPTDHGGHCTAT
jgi:(R,R)-butanediol dehydrogenase/meso-butanediol dehydrogenase/diacetyl reductase